MKVLSILVLFTIFVEVVMAQRNDATRNTQTKDKAETVEFCDLISNKQTYEGRTVRVTAIFAYGGEDFEVLYCPLCLELGTLQIQFSDEFDKLTKRKYLKMVDRGKHPSGTVKIVVLGKLQSSTFVMEKVEKAIYISKEFDFPDRLSHKLRKNVNCEM